MKILITGGAGFIGSNLVRFFLDEGHDVVVLDNFNDAYDPNVKEKNLAGTKAHIVRGDVCDLACVRTTLAGGIDAVIHLAAYAGVRESLDNIRRYEAVNVGGTATLLEALRTYAPIPLVVASSSSVYGARRDGPFRETDPADMPVSPYAATKRAAELLCASAHAAWGLPVICLRLFTVFGPRQRATMAIARFVSQALSGHPLSLYGDVDAMRDYTWVGDVARAMQAALEQPRDFQIINIGTGRPVRLAEVAEEVRRATGCSIEIRNLPHQQGDVPLTHADITRAKEMLGWSPAVSFSDGIRAYVEWVKQEEVLHPIQGVEKRGS